MRTKHVSQSQLAGGACTFWRSGISSVSIAVVLLTSNTWGARVEAVPGEPFGVAEITIPFPPADVAQMAGLSACRITELEGRVLYPAFNQGFLKRLMGGSAPPPSNLTLLFLFRGTTPFELTVYTPSPQRISVVPQARPSRVGIRLLRKWWRYYTAFFEEQKELGDHPPIVGTYLTSMLARRLNLPTPLRERIAENDTPGEDLQTLHLLTGAQDLRLATLRANSLGAATDLEQATLPVPPSVEWLPVQPVDDTPIPEIEPIAAHVPEECFYIRFGNFSNYLWFSQLLEDYGGDIASMVSARGYQDRASQRVQQQLGLKQTVLAEVLGPTVISDVAIIGRDTYLKEGAAIGILFEARTSLLGVNLAGQRKEALKQFEERGAIEETVRIADHDVSFYSTPDNQLRSFYATDGKYHLVTTCRAMVERFYESGQGKRPLSANPEFQHARALLPLDRNDTAFVYMSTEFFQGLLDPQYQIELARRLTAVTDIELLQMARWAARHEGVSGDTVSELTAAGLLPQGFGQRPDESGPILMSNGTMDSLRGGRGTFLPVPDVPLRGVTPTENAMCVARAEHLAENWKKMDPLLVAVNREVLADTRQERVTFDAIISPLEETKYSWILSMLGAPTTTRLVPPNGSIINVEASLRGGLLFPSVPPHLMFLGVQDHAPLTDLRPTDLLKTLQIVRTTPGYLGAWPKPGFLDMLPFQLGSAPDAFGFSQLPLGIWRWQNQGYSVLSLDHGILSAVSQEMQVQDAENEPAQIRIHVGDLSQAQFSHWITAMNYERARQVSVGNARLLNLLTQQLGVPRLDAWQVAETLLGGPLACAMGGEYRLVGDEDLAVWQSTAWPDSLNYTVPEEFESTFLSWFRGLDANVIKRDSQLVLHATLIMQRKQSQGGVRLPSLDMFRAPPEPSADDG
jgi:hypothetical protein